MNVGIVVLVFVYRIYFYLGLCCYLLSLGYQRCNHGNAESAVFLSSTEWRSSICKLYSGAIAQLSLYVLLRCLN